MPRKKKYFYFFGNGKRKYNLSRIVLVLIILIKVVSTLDNGCFGDISEADRIKHPSLLLYQKQICGAYFNIYFADQSQTWSGVLDYKVWLHSLVRC